MELILVRWCSVLLYKTRYTKDNTLTNEIHSQIQCPLEVNAKASITCTLQKQITSICSIFLFIDVC